MFERSMFDLVSSQADAIERWAERLARREGVAVADGTQQMFVEGPLSPLDGCYRLLYRYRVS
jgi:hypothetical protein